MPRAARVAPGGVVYHVLNRGVGRAALFETPDDFDAFLVCMRESLSKAPLRVVAYCLMPNHWHLVLWPAADGELARFMHRLANTHVRRWLTFRERVGTGHVYQGRYKSFACQEDGHLLALARYVERNPLRAGLVPRAEAWRWSSLGQAALTPGLRVPLSTGAASSPIERDARWVEWVNRPRSAAEDEALRRCVRQGRPFGSDEWLARTMAQLGWREPARPGRPKARPG